MRLLCFFVLLLVAPVSLADELRTLGGKTIRGTVTKLNETEVTLNTDAGAVATPLSQVLALELRSAKEPTGAYSSVRLLDDTALNCSQVVFTGKDVELTLLSGTTLKLPLNYIVAVVHEAQNETLRKKFDGFAANKTIKKDRIVIKSEGDLNPIEGTLGEVDATKGTILFKRDGAADLAIPINKLHGLIFHRLEVPTETPICRVIDVAGNTLAAVKVGLDKDAYNITTTFGAKISLKGDVISKLDFNLGKLTFLSDLEPARVTEKSGVGLITRYRKDTNLDGEPIILEKQHGKGLSMHAHTELEYNLAGKYKEFKAILGVDARTGADSQALVTIYCDGDKRFSEVASPKATKPIALNVKDVNTLKIVVSSRNFLDLHDHATLAEARVSQ